MPSDDTAKLVVARLEGEVGPAMSAYVDRLLKEQESNSVLILDINTLGGEINAAIAIRDALLASSGPTVAYVHPRAISAGALIAYATDVIVVADGATIGAATPVVLGEQGMQPVEQKVVAYMREEMRSTAEAKNRRGDIAAAMVDPDIAIDDLIAQGKTLALTGEAALRVGVASFAAANLDELIIGLGYDPTQVEVAEVSPSLAEGLAGWLTSTAVAALLMSLGLMGISIGLYTGGDATALTLGATCLGLFFFGHAVVNLAGIETWVLFGLGVVLIGLEIGVPGHVVPGVLGGLCIAAALVLGLVDLHAIDISTQWELGTLRPVLQTLGIATISTTALLFVAARYLPNSRAGARLMLHAAIQDNAAQQLTDDLDQLLGEPGVVVGALRPGGSVRVGERRFDALLDFGFADSGDRVEVIGRSGVQLRVALRTQADASHDTAHDSTGASP